MSMAAAVNTQLSARRLVNTAPSPAPTTPSLSGAAADQAGHLSVVHQCNEEGRSKEQWERDGEDPVDHTRCVAGQHLPNHW